MFKRFIAVAVAGMFAAGVAYAQGTASGPAAQPMSPMKPGTTSSNCEAKAVGKDGKPLSGAAKTSFMKKCEAGMKGSGDCESKAVGSNGKPLTGAAKTSFMKKCEAAANK
jgi:hypothetical protein